MSLAVLCPGQGGQHPALFDLFEATPAIASARRGVRAAAGFDPLDLVRDASAASRLFDNAIAQPLICAAQWTTWATIGPPLSALGIAPTLFAGYSVGELAAYGCAGALPLADLLSLSVQRAGRMDAGSRPGDGLAAVRGWPRTAVDAGSRAHGVHVAIVNGDDHFIVGGTGADLDAFTDAASIAGAAVQRLAVGVAAHTPLLADAATAFAGDLAEAGWVRNAVPVVAGIDGSLVRTPASAVDVLARQVSHTIDWSACMDAVRERGATVCLELGPGAALARMFRERHPDVATRSVADFRSIDAVVDWVERSLG